MDAGLDSLASVEFQNMLTKARGGRVACLETGPGKPFWSC